MRFKDLSYRTLTPRLDGEIIGELSLFQLFGRCPCPRLSTSTTWILPLLRTTSSIVSMVNHSGANPNSSMLFPSASMARQP